MLKKPSWPPRPPHLHDLHILTDSLEQAKLDLFIAVNYADEPAVYVQDIALNVSHTLFEEEE